MYDSRFVRCPHFSHFGGSLRFLDTTTTGAALEQPDPEAKASHAPLATRFHSLHPHLGTRKCPRPLHPRPPPVLVVTTASKFHGQQVQRSSRLQSCPLLREEHAAFSFQAAD
jgi:hypothetical protein